MLYGSITGTVTDTSGAVVPNAPVVITNESTGEVRNAVANGQGDYALRDVLPGPYTVSVNPTGNFGKATQSGIRVEVNRAVRVDFSLQPGNVTSQVVVITTAPLLQTETAEVSHDITETQLTQLPVTSSQGRQYQALYTIIPGAAAVAEQNSTASNPSRAMSVNFNGINDMSNTTRIDGAVNYYGWLPYLIAYVLPVDSIDENAQYHHQFWVQCRTGRGRRRIHQHHHQERHEGLPWQRLVVLPGCRYQCSWLHGNTGFFTHNSKKHLR